MTWETVNDFYNNNVFSNGLPLFGAIHLLYICAAIALVILYLFTFRRGTRNQIRGLIILTWVLLALNEMFMHQFGMIALYKTSNDFVYNNSYTPVQVTSLLLWLLPFYFFLPFEKWEKTLLPLIGISSLGIGGFILAYPLFVFTESVNLSIALFYLIQAGLTFALGCYLTLKGTILIKNGFTYLNYIVGMSLVVIISVLLNEIVYQASNEETVKLFNFLGLSHRIDINPYWKDAAEQFELNVNNKTLHIAFISLYVTTLVFASLVPYALFYGLFRPLVKVLDNKYYENKQSKDTAKMKEEKILNV